ncbi:uncharacterized protein PAE49_004052 isoform 2-T2 [Odontesthes bonariensis]|uniref:uncharacterized protein LOC142378774 isoform X2 n=1 Tax=Odontesthes bonariensis TaxID=219752 RepID=UPI003F585CED
MWRSKMAARWRGEDGNLNTSNSEFMASNTLNEVVLSRGEVEGVDMDAQSCVDHSILAIFEDSTVASGSKNDAEEESETLLSALTEMLDSVEDDGRTLSPFDILPDSELLGHSDHRVDSVALSAAHRLRPRPKPPNMTFKTKTDGEDDRECKAETNGLPLIFKKQSQMFSSNNKRAEAEVEVFTSTSLVSLVKLMHSYSLKLHVEEGDELRKNASFFSQEEVWRYERPSGESDEEINVVSDDEAAVKDEDEADGKRDNRQLLKSVLLNGNSSRAAPSRERKRVSFGPVQVTLFGEAVEKELNEESLVSGHTSESESVPPKSTEALELPALSSERNDDKAEVQEETVKKGETKAKSLSLQQYRQLRQKRRPLVEKQGDYTTKWPSVSEPPKELTPIFCFQGQNRPKMTPDLHKPLYKTSTHHSSSLHTPEATFLHRSGLKRPKTESGVISPASSLPDIKANPNVTVPQSKKSPVKKPHLLSSDPPNPVLLPMPVPQIPSPSTPDPSAEPSVETVSLQEESSAATPQHQANSSGPKSCVSSLNKGFNPDDAQPQEAKARLTEVCSVPSSQTGSVSQSRTPKNPPSLPPLLIQPPPHLDPPRSDALHAGGSSQKPSPPPPGGRAESGIEAPDLTSLLEQFEETQAIEDCDELICATSPSKTQTDGHRPEPAGSEKSSRLTPSVEPLEPLSSSGNLPYLQTVDAPEPLCNEIILSTRQEPPARRKNVPSKAIKIIDPRPLPSRKIHTSPSESPAAQTPTHVFSYFSCDHDYCGPVDCSPVSASQRSGVKSSLLRETTTEPQVTAQNSRAGKEQKNISDGQTASVSPHHSEQPRTRSEADVFSDSSAAEDGGANTNRTAACSLPTPPPSPPARGRDKRRHRRSQQSDSSSSSRSSSFSSSSSSSASCSPKRPRIHRRRSGSSSCSSSPSYRDSRSPPQPFRLSYPRYSRSRSRSWSRSRSPSRSPSPRICRRRWREVCSRESRRLRREHEMRIQKLKAIDERRVVYVGRIGRTMTHDELRERFSQFGEVECVSLHFRDRGDHFAFVTFYNTEDAFAAIDNGGKLRRPDELPFDICFGGRRQFCNSDYADLDANRDAESPPPRSRFEDLDFDSLLKQAQRGMKR